MDPATTDSNKVIFGNTQFNTEYLNSKAGLRQNFIIKSKPANNPKTLQLHIQTKGNWYVNKAHDHELHFAKMNGNQLTSKIIYNSLKVWDANNKELLAKFIVNKKHTAFEIEVNAADAVYPVTIDPISTTPSATLEVNQASALFATSVASAGDVNGDGYGDIIVGAVSYSNGQSSEGAFYIFQGSATGISTTPAAAGESNQASANMGWSVSSAGDVNGDGYSDVIVGVYAYDDPQVDEGAAFIYYGSATGINPASPVILEANQAGANFGISVAMAGDVNGDGYSDVVVGAPFYSNGQASEGAAFIYLGSAAGIITTPATILDNDQSNSWMGYSVASAGDINGDGYSDVIVGAYYYDDGDTDEGAAFLYLGSAAGINPLLFTKLECNQASALMGYTVASAGDVNGDGYSDVVVGAYDYDSGQTDEGAAFVYYGSASGINTVAATMVQSDQAFAHMGSSVMGLGDVNGDGYSDIGVGAYYYDHPEIEEGAAFFYYGSATGISTVATMMVESNQTNAYMGFRNVASAGDINGDGYSDIIVGAYAYDHPEVDEGIAYIYQGSPDGLKTTNN
ncbi:MAG: integrin alpha, partial [Chitinophagaceae bacterium]